ncbi:MAG TPA: matrixin family metalloprotease [Candidatus Nanoarchaeia archaeon]|nr:matrixin family metalloprotease [Candidatus Nanoarchaeia archaeon]
MSWNAFFGFIFFLIVLVLLGTYWFLPLGEIDFSPYVYKGNSNISVGNFSDAEQFYDNMRYQKKVISYSINDCPLSKQDEMERAFEIVSNLTVLEFYSVNSGEEISVTCDSKTRFDEEKRFIAGEGGPSKIIQSGDFNVILNGDILLIRESKCPRPNIAIHELFHALGYNHSENPGSVMYSVTNCEQEVEDDLIKSVNEIYSFPSNPDLVFENVSATMNGKYLDANMTIKNIGLIDSNAGKVVIYADEKQIHEVELSVMGVGRGFTISVWNVYVPKISISEIKFAIVYNQEELQKNNNKIILKIKK